MNHKGTQRRAKEREQAIFSLFSSPVVRLPRPGDCGAIPKSREAACGKPPRKNPKSGLKVFILCVFLAALPPAGASGQPPASEYPWPREELEQVLASPDFGGEEDSWGIRLRETGETTKEERRPSPLDLSFFWRRMRNIQEFFGKALRDALVIVIAAAAGIVIFLLRRTKRNAGSASGETRFLRGKSPGSPENSRGLLAEARRLHARGDIRGAWACCLRASRAAYTASLGLVFAPGATEYNCLHLVRAACGDASGGFGRLVDGWIQAAYAGRLPPAEAFEEACEFCRRLAEQPGEEKAGA
jgi:hypothetical protein